MNFITRDFKQTQKLAVLLAKEISRAEIARQNAFVVALVGDLGSGKTTFTQGFVKGFGIKEKITSPTFVLMHRHQIKMKSQISPPKADPPLAENLKSQKTKIGHYKNLYHFDCYRLGKPEEILTLGLKEIIANPQNVVLIEWADKIKKFLPKNSLKIKFEWFGKDKRKIEIIH